MARGLPGVVRRRGHAPRGRDASAQRRGPTDAGQTRWWLAAVMGGAGCTLTLWALCAGASSSCSHVAGEAPAAAAGPVSGKASTVTLGPKGRWGQLEYTRIEIRPVPALLAGFHPDSEERIPLSPDLVAGLSTSGLAPDTVSGLRRGLSRLGPWWMLSDLKAVMSSLADDDQRRGLVSVVTTVDSYIARLRIDSTTDLEAAARYWAPPTLEESDDVRPLLASLARVPGGASVDLDHLLPAFARQHANRYPHVWDPVESRADCFWTALNFSAAQPNDDAGSPAFVVDMLKNRYRPVGGPPSLGDLVVLLNGQGRPVHAAVYIADDLVFTKNGNGQLRPWTYMKLGAMVDFYTTLEGPLRPVTVAPIGSVPR